MKPNMRIRFGHDLRPLAYLGVAFPVALILLAASPFGTNFIYVMMGIPALLLCWFGAGIWSAVLCALYLSRKQWLLSFLAAILPTLLVFAALNLVPFIQRCNYIGGVIHFVVARPYYDHQIALLPHTNQPRLAVFNWGGMVWASSGLVYDESDEVTLPPGQRSRAWLNNPGLAELSCEGYSVTPLWSHYYLAYFPC
jgi:hypothetical protein